jgi:hypothetical protein
MRLCSLPPATLLSAYTDAVIDAADGTGKERDCIPLEVEIVRRLKREWAMTEEAHSQAKVAIGEILYDSGVHSAANAILDAGKDAEAR